MGWICTQRVQCLSTSYDLLSNLVVYLWVRRRVFEYTLCKPCTVWLYYSVKHHSPCLPRSCIAYYSCVKGDKCESEASCRHFELRDERQKIYRKVRIAYTLHIRYHLKVITILLTTWSGVLIKDLLDQLFKKFPLFYENWKLAAAFTGDKHWTICGSRWIQLTQPTVLLKFVSVFYSILLLYIL
jgi:hypothetical protein